MYLKDCANHRRQLRLEWRPSTPVGAWIDGWIFRAKDNGQAMVVF
jgi:hypothetical protein